VTVAYNNRHILQNAHKHRGQMQSATQLSHSVKHVRPLSTYSAILLKMHTLGGNFGFSTQKLERCTQSWKHVNGEILTVVD